MTPLKPMRRLSSLDADVSMEAADFESTMLASPPKTAGARARGPSGSIASRLFADDDDDEDCVSGFSFPRTTSILKPLDLNLALSDGVEGSSKLEPIHRKRHAEQNLDGRDLSFEDMESPVDMHTSPRISPGDCYKSPASHRPGVPHKSPSSFRTLDGRTVQSKNPFSPMIMDNAARAQEAAANTPAISDSLNFPLSFQEDNKKKEGDEVPIAGAVPLLRHKLQKRDTLLDPSTFRSVSYHYNSFTRDGYPEKKGMYSFTGSPIKEMEVGGNMSINSHKVRRIKKDDDVVAAAKEPSHYGWRKQLNVNTQLNFYGQPDDVSPTDVMSFPLSAPSSPSGMPPTPTKPKHYRRRQTRYTPIRKSVAPPQTPMPKERRGRSRSFDEVDGSPGSPPPNSAQKLAPQSRFHSDFDVISELGNGSFGNVVKVLSRLDGCMYAIKVAHRPAKGNADKDRMLKEVYALAALSDQADTATFHIVRYHQAWMEENRLYIQTELCTTTMSAEMERGPMSIKRRYKFLREVCLALEFIHKNGMVHLDIKPENIFIKNDQFKLGDFGLVSKVSNHQDVEEGDSRYMSMELLSGDHDDLTKSDIFSLGITLCEVCLAGKQLPTNGPEWQALRAGDIPKGPDTPGEMQRIMKLMMNPSYKSRPSASELLKRPQLLSDEQKALLEERNKVVQANLALLNQENRLRMLAPPMPKKGVLVRRGTWSGA